jgi:hypothetical protein
MENHVFYYGFFSRRDTLSQIMVWQRSGKKQYSANLSDDLRKNVRANACEARLFRGQS